MKFLTRVRLGLLAAVVVAGSLVGLTQVRAADEVIADWYSDITVSPDGSLELDEVIVYDFATNQRHGIFRDLSLTSKDGPNLVAEVLAVTDEENNPITYTEDSDEQALHVKIGDPDETVSGKHTYIISYRIYNAIRQFADHAELYWNVTGNEWSVPILGGGALVKWPEINTSSLAAGCFTGPVGSKAADCEFETTTSSVDFYANTEFKPSEGMTIFVSFPLGVISTTTVAATATTDNQIPTFVIMAIVGGILVTLTMIALLVWNKMAKTRLPRALKNQPIIVAYNPPDDLRPIEVGAIIDRKVDVTDISAVIMDLAVRGYLKIRYVERVVKFGFDKKDFELVKSRDGADLTNAADTAMFNLLFADREQVLVSELEKSKTTFQSVISTIRKDLETSLFTRDYFDVKAKKTIKIAGAVLFVCILVAALGNQMFGGVIFFVGILGVMISIVVMSFKNNQLSAKGVATLAQILGFKEFLSMTETDRLRLLNAPDLKPEVFEKWLAYAMVLGVEQKWAAKFADLYVTNPAWYDGGVNSTGFNSVSFARQMSLFGTSFNHVYQATTPSSGSSGGFSGGGSGGGGGGSW